MSTFDSLKLSPAPRWGRRRPCKSPPTRSVLAGVFFLVYLPAELKQFLRGTGDTGTKERTPRRPAPPRPQAPTRHATPTCIDQLEPVMTKKPRCLSPNVTSEAGGATQRARIQASQSFCIGTGSERIAACRGGRVWSGGFEPLPPPPPFFTPFLRPVPPEDR